MSSISIEADTTANATELVRMPRKKKKPLNSPVEAATWCADGSACEANESQSRADAPSRIDETGAVEAQRGEDRRLTTANRLR